MPTSALHAVELYRVFNECESVYLCFVGWHPHLQLFWHNFLVRAGSTEGVQLSVRAGGLLCPYP